MKNISKIIDRLSIKFLKERTLLIFFAVQNTVIALIVLIFSNVIISNANVVGELDYFQIGVFNNICILLLFLSIFISVPTFIAGVYNELYNSNVIEHLLAVKVTNGDIVTAILVRGFIYSFIVFLSSCPIVLMSFFFIGDGALKIIKIIIYLVSFMTLYSTISLYISTKTKNANISIFISYILGFILMLFNVVYLNLIIHNLRFYIIYLVLSLILSLIIFSMSKKSINF